MATEPECSMSPQRSVRFGDEEAKEGEPMKLVVRHTFLELERNSSAPRDDRRRAKSDIPMPFKFDGNEWVENQDEVETELGTEANGSPDSVLDQERARNAASAENSAVLLPGCCLVNDPDQVPDENGDRGVVPAAADDDTGNSRKWSVPDEAISYDFPQTKNTPSRASEMEFVHTDTMVSRVGMGPSDSIVSRTPMRTPGVRSPARRRKNSDQFYTRHSDAAYPGNAMGMPMPPWGQMPMPGMPLPAEVNAKAGHAAFLEMQAANLRFAASQAESAAATARQIEKSPKEASPHGFPVNPWMMFPPMPPPMPMPHPFPQAPGMPPGWPGVPWPMGGGPAWPTAPAAKAGPPEPTKSEKKEKKTPKPHSGPKDEKDFTTVMLRNLPNDYNRDMLLELLDAQGFAGCYDFVYLPIDFKKQSGLGYAFLNLLTHDDAERLRTKLQGFSEWNVPTQKVLEVSWSQPLQGLTANIERYKNSPVMHQDVPEHFKPLLFKDGQKTKFPQPAKRIRPPVTH